MKHIFQILVVLLAISSLAQAVALAKVKNGETSDASTSKSGSTGPGI